MTPFDLKGELLSQIEKICTTKEKVNGQHVVYVITGRFNIEKQESMFFLYSSIRSKKFMGTKKVTKNEKKDDIVNYSFVSEDKIEAGTKLKYDIYISINRTKQSSHLLKRKKYGLASSELNCKGVEYFNKGIM